ncbi:MAG TPA: PIG-L family deacetylase [Spirochaetia bacterium]|nr:PIG-L family deacetylase [Spirochaetia bacterium]
MADILVFGAHPDDAEFGMGASMVKFVRSGASVTVCVLTRGEAGTFGTGEQREREMRQAAEKLGGEIEILDFQDCRISDTYESRVRLAEVVRKHRPRIVFAPYHTNPSYHKDGAAHPDHTATGTIVRSALRYARFSGLKDVKGEPWNADHLIYYMVPRTRTPNLINDVSDYMKEWEAIARCHESQMSLRNGKVLDALRRFRETAGVMVGVAYAEGFYVEEPLVFDLAHFLTTSSQPGGIPTEIKAAAEKS